MEGKVLFLGWSRSNPQPWRQFTVPHLMVNVADFLTGRVAVASVRLLLDYRGSVFCDSGGYQAFRRRQRFTPSVVIAMQRRLGAQLNAALDDANHPKRHMDHLRIPLIVITESGDRDH